MAMREFGPAPARPVIRGLDGDRVSVLEDGQRMGDLSSQSGDHCGADQSGRGAQDRSGARSRHAALRRQRDRRPRQRDHRLRSRRERTPGHHRATSRSISAATAARPAAPATFMSATASSRCTSAAAGNARATTRRPKARSTTRSRAWRMGQRRRLVDRRDSQYVGASYGYDDSKYGIPVVEEGADQPDAAAPFVQRPRRRPEPGRLAAVVSRHARRARATSTTSSKATKSARTFHNDTVEGEVLLSHKRAGRLSAASAAGS